MDNETRNHALDKVESMSTYIAYQDKLLDDTELEKIYSKLEINEGNYLQSILNLTLFNKVLEFDALRKPVDMIDILFQNAGVNVFYIPIINSIRKYFIFNCFSCLLFFLKK